MTKISPSTLAANVLNAQQDIQRIVHCGVDFLHMDIMDGHFVPNISYGPAFVKAVHEAFSVPLDVHLMITEPLNYIESFAKAGSNIITVHYEIDTFEQSIALIKKLGLKAGASVKPNTPIDVLFPYLNQLDLVLIMTVEPGFGGQSFMPACVSKIEALKKQGYQGLINVDGGINMQTSSICTQAGANMLVMGTALFGAQNPQEVVDYIHSL